MPQNEMRYFQGTPVALGDYLQEQCRIVEGGGSHFGDDLWTCKTCGHQKYPEVFECPRRGLIKPQTLKSSSDFGSLIRRAAKAMRRIVST